MPLKKQNIIVSIFRPLFLRNWPSILPQWRILSTVNLALKIFCILLLASSLSFSVQAQQQDAADSRELESIKRLIAQTQAQLEKKMADSERLQQELKLAELKIAQTATQLNKTDKRLNSTKSKLKKLNLEKIQIKRKIDNQQNALKSQIKSAYMAGDYDFAKMIFNQDEAGKFERVLTYYQYLNKARQTQIESFRALISELESVQVELDREQAELSNLLVKQSSQSSQLRNQQEGRFNSLRALERQIKSDQSKVTQLQQQENDLANAIEQAELASKRAREAANNEDIELLGLSTKQKKLLVPVSGIIQRLFGKRRQGQVRWKGIIINANAGAPVSAVADGVVLYADWLKGFGLVTIVDHGKGYMSVYGRNQALLKNVGDFASAGESISLVGNSGGQALAGLYFEIRHKGKALNPSQWLAGN